MMNRTIVVNDVEPAVLSMRAPTGLEFILGIKFLKQNKDPIDLATLLPQLVLLPRSTGGVFATDVVTVDGQLGYGKAQIPATALVDRAGYNLELYQRVPAIAPEDPPYPTGLLAKGALILEGSSYQGWSPLAPIIVPVITGPQGPQGAPGADSTVPGPVGPKGQRGSIWTTGVGNPVATGSEVEGDMYLDEGNGNVWRWSGGAWALGVF